MSYKKQEFRSGDKLTAASLNAMDDQIFENSQISDWAKQPEKPVYTAEEVGALSRDEVENYYSKKEINDLVEEIKTNEVFVGSGDPPEGTKLQIDPEGEVIDIPTMQDIDRLSQQIDQISEYVTPQMFGAVADGFNDDTEAVQAALDAGGIVYFPAGLYKVTKQLTTSKPCIIKMFKQYPSRYWRSGSTPNRYDYPIVLDPHNYEPETGWDFGARIECYPSTNEEDTCGLLIGGGVEVDGLFMRAMNGFKGTLLCYNENYAYNFHNNYDSDGNPIQVPITYISYPSSMRFKHIRLDCDRQHEQDTIPESMFDFIPKDGYMYQLEDIVIGQMREYAKYGFRSVVVPQEGETSIEWANSVRITNLCLTGPFDYPLYIEGTYPLTNWIFDGCTVQTFSYNMTDFEKAMEGHKAIITLKNMSYTLFTGCHIYDLYNSKFTKLFDCENLGYVSCVGCGDEFYNGTLYTHTIPADRKEPGIETFLNDRFATAGKDANISTLGLRINDSGDEKKLELYDQHDNCKSVDLPSVVLSSQEISNGINSWMDKHSTTELVCGRNKFNRNKSNSTSSRDSNNTDVYADGYEKNCYPNDNMFTTHFIAVKPKDVVRWAFSGNTQPIAYRFNYFDSNYNHIYTTTDYVYNKNNVGHEIPMFDDYPDVSYIRITFVVNTITNLYLDRISESELCVTINNLDVSYTDYWEELQGGLSKYFLLQSPSGKKFTLSIEDDGTIIGRPVEE